MMAASGKTSCKEGMFRASAWTFPSVPKRLFKFYNLSLVFYENTSYNTIKMADMSTINVRKDL